jgi:pilus assembly protein Flp/PilA
MYNRISTFLKDDSGATAIEYGLIAALVSVAALAALTAMGTWCRRRRTRDLGLSPAARGAAPFVPTGVWGMPFAWIVWIAGEPSPWVVSAAVGRHEPRSSLPASTNVRPLRPPAGPVFGDQCA